ncbi:ADP-ribosylglycohydrolase family protein [Pelagibacterium sp.]|uniref:ADP-ribosylglycohydrolase family protein n=1 Tax=Pelagibacterium sp. TaxID=1967288 RepID=UPI003A905F89
MTPQADMRDRIYAGVLGKLIGVYLGRPFENWTYQRIMRELGPITYYVNEKLGAELVVTDDDVSGTFSFLRALEDYGCTPDLGAEDIGRTWLNYVVENRAIFWWGGAGNSTEHTAWLNLAKGIPAPKSGAMETNGKTVAEQIGAQIFIDGWALVSPGNPAQAAKLARQAASVSHDGESVNAAVLWAAMEAEAFVSKDADHLIETGLRHIPGDSLVARVIADIRTWVATNGDDWQATRQLIEDNYGYDKYPGVCHVVPNFALMIMAFLHAPHDFSHGQMIINTSGWDTDCNAGNLGCLQGIMLGLEGIDAGPDWRGPVADRLYLSTADGGRGLGDAAQMTLWLESLALRLAGAPQKPAPKNGAQFHFSLPASVQGFMAGGTLRNCGDVAVSGTGSALAVDLVTMSPGRSAYVGTPVFIPPSMIGHSWYEVLATPRVSPGQTLKARIIGDASLTGTVEVALALRRYGQDDALVSVVAPESVALAPGQSAELSWRIPQFDGNPVAEVGLVMSVRDSATVGRVLVDWLGWSGEPELTLRRPHTEGSMWRSAWINGASVFSKNFNESFRLAGNRGEGIILTGTRDWADYTVETSLNLHLGDYGALVVRAHGLRHYYAVRLMRSGRVRIVCRRDEHETVLAEAEMPIEFETAVNVRVSLQGSRICAQIGDVSIEADDATYPSGMVGLAVFEGALSTDKLHITPSEGV